MKAKKPPADPKIREARIDYRQVVYSQGASNVMEQATGIRSAPLPNAVKAPAAAAVDAE
ncbi:MAG TPA: hypothetical protein VHM90_04430 [Phycisphaerae bacterium]|jgi:hypothetical protein|nr:hypothetical protein [Phycisphaerae bacterium]